MNAFDLSASGARKARIEIIPLIDVVFFLLATFVLFTLSLNKILSIPHNRPVPGGERIKEDTMVYLQASDDGTYYWKEGSAGVPELITTSELGPRLTDYRRRAVEPRVFVRGDAKAKFGSTIRALDEVRKAGIRQVSVETLTSGTGR